MNPTRRARRWYDRQLNRPTVRVAAAFRSGVQAATMFAGGDRRYRQPSAALNGATPVEHKLAPLVSHVVYPVIDSHWEAQGEWVLDVGGQPEHAQEKHASWVEALAAARALPEQQQTGDVVIRFRRFDGPGVNVFAEDSLPVEERLERLQREERSALSTERGRGRKFTGRKAMKRREAAWEQEQVG